MHPAVQTRVEGVRGCGYRKPGGLYMVNRADGESCGRIPFPLIVCPCCGEGFRPSRGFRWVDGQKLLETAPVCSLDRCPIECPFRSGNEENIGRSILIWVSPDNYPTPDDFKAEASTMGISRRIAGDQIPRGLIVGETWVFLAHRLAIDTSSAEPTPGVFRAFIPEMIEYIVKGNETDAEIESLVKRGITPVQVFNE